MEEVLELIELVGVTSFSREARLSGRVAAGRGGLHFYVEDII